MRRSSRPTSIWSLIDGWNELFNVEFNVLFIERSTVDIGVSWFVVDVNLSLSMSVIFPYRSKRDGWDDLNRRCSKQALVRTDLSVAFFSRYHLDLMIRRRGCQFHHQCPTKSPPIPSSSGWFLFFIPLIFTLICLPLWIFYYVYEIDFKLHGSFLRFCSFWTQRDQERGTTFERWLVFPIRLYFVNVTFQR